jgi:signal transduction histidine kinase
MNTTQIQTLLRDSNSHYRNRNLKKALNAAQIALDFGIEEGAPDHDLVEANLLLARIYNTNGLYQCDATFFEKALQNLEVAERLIKIEEPELLEIDILLEKGRIFQHQKQYSKSEAFFNQAFQKSQENSNTRGIVLSLAALSQVFVEKNDFEKALVFANDGLTFLENSDSSEDVILLAEIYCQLSQVLIKKQEYSQSLERSQTLLKLSRDTGDVEKELTALKNIAIVCGVKSNYKIGMQYFLDALDKSEEIGFRQNIVQILINIGTIYAHLFNYDEAIRRYQQVLDDHDDILDNKNKVIIYNNLGNIYYSLDDIQEAYGYFEKAHTLASQSDYKEMIGHSLAQLSRADIKLGNYRRAHEFAQLAEGLIEDIGDINGKQIHLLNLAKIAYRNKRLNRAINLTKQGIEIAIKLKDDASEIRAYKLLATLYHDRGDYQLAMHYQMIYSKIQEEFAKVQRNRQFLDMEIRHAIKEKQKEIEALTKENEYQSLLLDQSDQIARQNQELVRANEELRQFAYVASHDLKEPLRMIGSYTQLLERRIKDNLGETEKMFVHYITDGVGRMNKLLDALLKYATVGKSDEALVETDLNKIAEIATVNLKVRIEEAEATIHIEQLPYVKVYSSQMTQLFQNLIGNAIKFRRPNVKPVIRVACRDMGDSYKIQIIDNGIGIPEDSQSRVFDIFQRLHARTEYEGTGIGLAICQKIAQRHGGEIGVESNEGEGSTFYFSLPKSLGNTYP